MIVFIKFWASISASLSQKHFVNKNKNVAKTNLNRRHLDQNTFFFTEKNDRSFYHRERTMIFNTEKNDLSDCWSDLNDLYKGHNDL